MADKDNKSESNSAVLVVTPIQRLAFVVGAIVQWGQLCSGNTRVLILNAVSRRACASIFGTVRDF